MYTLCDSSAFPSTCTGSLTSRTFTKEIGSADTAISELCGVAKNSCCDSSTEEGYEERHIDKSNIWLTCCNMGINIHSAE